MNRFEILTAAWLAPATDTEMDRYAADVLKYGTDGTGRKAAPIERVGYSGVVIRDTHSGRKTFHNVTSVDGPVKLLCDALNAGSAAALAWFGRTAK